LIAVTLALPAFLPCSALFGWTGCYRCGLRPLPRHWRTVAVRYLPRLPLLVYAPHDTARCLRVHVWLPALWFRAGSADVRAGLPRTRRPRSSRTIPALRCLICWLNAYTAPIPGCGFCAFGHPRLLLILRVTWFWFRWTAVTVYRLLFLWF